MVSVVVAVCTFFVVALVLAKQIQSSNATDFSVAALPPPQKMS